MTSPEPAAGLVIVRGHATAEEVAAVVASLRQVDSRTAGDRYEQWRAGRLAALRANPPRIPPGALTPRELRTPQVNPPRT